jgi:hypothetical protein
MRKFLSVILIVCGCAAALIVMAHVVDLGAVVRKLHGG